ncbi:hypothetical protein GE21DRAFT_6093 [Neurospora crassa]|uniref:Uncharacterized protein n=1 Tax=Neurospora crassa (strain ATCC 24698 / 74-OR23-1A / CBS 708.71 / DSM 1257 / FGSC 987) TaxID=367110 RepID=V5IMD0_NEUCR|nr:hypothetical protein NCU16818 [Neurospora crassa OR74A]ESA42948.1 hypothetical protein NCU16818 [Neurospora crassa OR74A]KHE88572.1 hypothetical protein GE21DRAFT_6093 [Neurospora crassa]|eukprot:XP_011394405.1 hypothetical protein NCU16818 [Neurospora crassa OR74A]
MTSIREPSLSKALHETEDLDHRWHVSPVCPLSGVFARSSLANSSTHPAGIGKERFLGGDSQSRSRQRQDKMPSSRSHHRCTTSVHRTPVRYTCKYRRSFREMEGSELREVHLGHLKNHGDIVMLSPSLSGFLTGHVSAYNISEPSTTRTRACSDIETLLGFPNPKRAMIARREKQGLGGA